MRRLVRTVFSDASGMSVTPVRIDDALGERSLTERINDTRSNLERPVFQV
ncbi:hypothetical protein RRSWK_01892 [Rhodopirellula sp. SWK7]|nr:hypothetical protein RRSWK_01892 [Rhodopirellula sp. SWK7]